MKKQVYPQPIFVDAVKEDAHAIVAISGVSGSGKTYTALRFANLLADGGDVMVVDTEAGSARLYSDEFTFKTFEMRAPFHPERLTDSIQAAHAAGAEVLVIDSLSHFWNMEGGALELKDQIATQRYSNNRYMAWNEVTPIHRRMFGEIVNKRGPGGMHVIATMRSKTAYVEVKEERNGRTRTKYEKAGMGFEQREGSEYEFDLHLQLDLQHVGEVVKTRCKALDGETFPFPGENVIDIVKDWLKGSPEAKAQEEASHDALASASAAANMEDWSLCIYQVPAAKRFFEDVGAVIRFRSALTGVDGLRVQDNTAVNTSLLVFCEHMEQGESQKQAFDAAVEWYEESKPPQPVQTEPETAQNVVYGAAKVRLVKTAVEPENAPETAEQAVQTFGLDPRDLLQEQGVDIIPFELEE